LTNFDAYSLVTDGAEYLAPYYPADEMVPNIQHHSVKEKAILGSTIECYGKISLVPILNILKLFLRKFRKNMHE